MWPMIAHTNRYKNTISSMFCLSRLRCRASAEWAFTNVRSQAYSLALRLLRCRLCRSFSRFPDCNRPTGLILVRVRQELREFNRLVVRVLNRKQALPRVVELACAMRYLRLRLVPMEPMPDVVKVAVNIQFRMRW